MSKQTKAEHSIIWAQAMPFLPINQVLSFDLLTLEVVPESCVTWEEEISCCCVNFILPRPLCSRLRPDMRDRRTSDVRRASSLNASAIWGRCIIIVIVLLNVQLAVTVIEVTAFRLLKCSAQEHSERFLVGLRTYCSSTPWCLNIGLFIANYTRSNDLHSCWSAVITDVVRYKPVGSYIEFRDDHDLLCTTDNYYRWLVNECCECKQRETDKF